MINSTSILHLYIDLNRSYCNWICKNFSDIDIFTFLNVIQNVHYRIDSKIELVVISDGGCYGTFSALRPYIMSIANEHKWYFVWLVKYWLHGIFKGYKTESDRFIWWFWFIKHLEFGSYFFSLIAVKNLTRKKVKCLDRRWRLKLKLYVARVLILYFHSDF